MTTLEDKILGEKAHNYCSSDEEDNCPSSDESEAKSKSDPCSSSDSGIVSNMTYNKTHWSGTATNTGPKGVVNDWQRFKQLENEKRETQEKERIKLLKSLTMTSKTSAEDQAAKENEELDKEFEELMSEEFLKQFQRQRMNEMMVQRGGPIVFGQVFALNNGDDFLAAVDKENKYVTVVIHLYENNVRACKTMNKCLESLATDYNMVKFCKICSSSAGMSKHFKTSGVPALLVYKAGQMIGNFVRLSDELGEDFFSSDVESFLLEHAMLPDKTCISSIHADQ